MNMTGALIQLDGTSTWTPLVRTAIGWQARVLTWKPGGYRTGVVLFPDGTTTPCRTTEVINMVSPGIIYVLFLDTDEVGAEITRRMLALAA